VSGVNPQFGEAHAGDGVNAAHVQTALGRRDGPVGTAWATAMATPSAGHAPLVVVARPNLPVVPLTLLVNTATIASPSHAAMTRGAAQAGVAAGVLDLHRTDPDGELCIIAAVWVDPTADDEESVFEHNRAAVAAAINLGAAGGPWSGHLEGVTAPENAHFRRGPT
jgi:5,6,7,8-tetrahydromethanopterin hydro-lyase